VRVKRETIGKRISIVEVLEGILRIKRAKMGFMLLVIE